MKTILLLVAQLGFALALRAAPLEIPARPLAEKGEQLVADHFSHPGLGAWRAVIPTFTVADGVLRGSQTRADHGSVGAVKAPFKDGIIEFRFRLEGATGFNAVCDDKAWKESHAGHICRVTIAPKALRLGDDKEGAMRNDLHEMSKDPAHKAEFEKLVAGRGASFPMNFEQKRWYSLHIEIVGDEMRVVLDGQPVGYLKSSGLAHPTKSDFHFTVSGQDALFDDVGLWAAKK